jgi:hypothetical protein
MLRKLYKLTNQDMRTHDNTQWVLGEWKETDGQLSGLCNGSWLHAYQDPYIAALMNPYHGNFTNPRLFEAEGDGEFLDDYGMKCGVTKLRLVKEIPLPVITDEQRLSIAIKCLVALQRYINTEVSGKITEWTTNWLSNKDRSIGSVEDLQSILFNNYLTLSRPNSFVFKSDNFKKLRYNLAFYVLLAYIQNTQNAYGCIQYLKSIENFDLGIIIKEVLEEGK